MRSSRIAAGLALTAGLLATTPAHAASITQARAALSRQLGPTAVLKVDPARHTLAGVMDLGHTLTKASGKAPATIARDYLVQHATAFGITAADAKALKTMKVIHAPGGLTTVRFGTFYGAIPDFDGATTVGLDRRGRIVSITGAPIRSPKANTLTATLGAAQAMQRLAGRLPAPVVTKVARGVRQLTTFSTGDIGRLVVSNGRLAWHLTYEANALAWYDAVVDATTGKVLRKVNIVRHAANAQVFPNFPGANAGGSAITVDLEALGWLPAGASLLSGPNVYSYGDLAETNSSGLLGEGDINRTSAGDFVFPFQSFGGSANTPRCEDHALCSWNSGTTGLRSWTTNESETGVQEFYFDNLWHDHLKAAPIGFDKASGNFEGDDPVQAESDDGADSVLPNATSPFLNNANMSTPVDGMSPRMQMYLGSYNDLQYLNLFRDYNNSDDAGTVFHEYTHGLSSRLVTNEDGSEALDDDEPGAMGEAWSDWYAYDYLVRQGLTPDTATQGEVDLGIYSDAVPHSTRAQGLDCKLTPVDATHCPAAGTAGAGGFTYGDFGKVSSGPEVHADGIIWSQTLWDIRTDLVALAGSQAGGSDIAEALVTGGLRLSPPEPSYLDVRDAILQTDVALFGGEHLDLLWRDFAARGMGFDASATGGSDDAPKEGFALPPTVALTGAITATPAQGIAGQNVTLTATSFPDENNKTAKSYSWDFDSNGTVDARTTSPAITHVFPIAGSYTVTVKVADAKGGAGSAVTALSVVAPPTPAPLATSTAPAAKPGTPAAAATTSLAVSGSAARGQARARVRCATACKIKATVTVSSSLAKSLKLKKRTLVTKSASGKAGARVVLTLTVPKSALAAAKRHHLRHLTVTVKLTAGSAKAKTKVLALKL